MWCMRRHNAAIISTIYPSYFKLHVRWLPLLTPVTYLSKLLGIRAVAAFLKLELFRVGLSNLERFRLLPDNKRMNMGLSPDKP